MNWLGCLVCLVWSASPQIEVTTLSGETFSGTLTALNATELQLENGADSQKKISTRELLDVVFKRDAAPAPPSTSDTAPLAVVELVDGHHLSARRVTSTSSEVKIQHPALGQLSLPRAQVQSVRLSPEDSAVASAWKDLKRRDKKQDYLVIRKGDVLDHLDGVVGALDEASLKFLLDGEQVDVKRARIFGWVHATQARKPVVEGLRVNLTGGDSLAASSIRWENGQWLLQIPGQQQAVTLPPESVQSLDYSAGRVLFLSAQEPRDVEYVDYFGFGEDLQWRYQRDSNLFGRPLKVGTRTYSRGLALHSKTRLVYRLGGDYRRLTAVVGLDPELLPNAEPAINNARLTIRGDKKVLFEADVRAGEAPVPLDLPVAGVIEVEILVDYGQGHLDIGDRVHLGDLKVLK